MLASPPVLTAIAALIIRVVLDRIGVAQTQVRDGLVYSTRLGGHFP